MVSNAFAIVCWRPKLFHYLQTETCVASIRDMGYYDQDIVILTLEDRAVPLLKRCCGKYNVIVKKVEPIVLFGQEWIDSKINHIASILDPNKHYYWSLTDYDNVIGLDSDCWLFGNVDHLWDYDGFITWNGAETGPVCAAMMTVKPSMDTFQEMRHLLLNSTFDFQTGWNNCGRVKGVEGYEDLDWELCRFQSADSFQGFVLYYFHFIKKTFLTAYDRNMGIRSVGHGGGFKKGSKYTAILKKYLRGKVELLGLR